MKEAAKNDNNVSKIYVIDDKFLRLSSGQQCIPRRLVPEILQIAHDSPSSGHLSLAKTIGSLRDMCWPRKESDVDRYIHGCDMCKRHKASTMNTLAAPRNIEYSERRWESVSMDFIAGPPRTKTGYDSITTYVNRFSKRRHFVPCKESEDAVHVAKSFHDNVFRLHGLPD